VLYSRITGILIASAASSAALTRLAMKSSPWPAAPARSRQDYQDRREQLLVSAAELFVEKGFRDAGLTDLAERMSISKPALYHYIGGKEDLLFEIAGRALDAISGALDEAAAREGSGREKLEAFLPAYIDVATTRFGRCLAQTDRRSLAPARQEELNGKERKHDEALRKILREGVRDGSLQDLDPRMTAFMILGAVSWIPRWHRGEERLSADQLAKGFVQIIERGFARRP